MNIGFLMKLMVVLIIDDVYRFVVVEFLFEFYFFVIFNEMRIFGYSFFLNV